MKDYADLHTHTIASGHAYGTITEMVHAAALKNLPILGITEHAPSMPGSCGEMQLQCDPAGLRGCPSFIRM